MTPKSFDHDDLGIDLDSAAKLPECHACRKKSDGAKVVEELGNKIVLCGAHFDEWLARHKRRDFILASDFARELREGRYRPCWEAKIEE